MATATPFATREDYLAAVTAATDAADAYYNNDAGDVVMDDATYDQLARDIVATEAIHPQWASGSVNA